MEKNEVKVKGFSAKIMKKGGLLFAFEMFFKANHKYKIAETYNTIKSCVYKQPLLISKKLMTNVEHKEIFWKGHFGLFEIGTVFYFYNVDSTLLSVIT